MKFLYFYFICSYIICITSSCNNTKTTFHSENKIPDGCTVISFPDLKDSGVIAYSDIFSGVEYIPLENNTYSAIGIVSKLMVTADGDFIAYDNKNGIIARYDKNGAFLNKIGEKGHQKDEYIKLIDVAYDQTDNQIIAWDNVKKSILFYDVTGNLVKKEKSDVWHGTLEVLDSNYFAICTSNKIESHPDAFKYLLLNKKGKKEKEFMEYSSITGFQRASNNIFSLCDDKLFCHTEYSSNIFEFTNDSLIPRYHLSFDNNGIPEEWFEYDREKFSKMLHKNEDITYCYRFFETAGYFVTTLCRGKLYLCIKEKDGNKVYAGYNLRNDLTGIKVIDEAGGLANMSTIIPLNVNNRICYFVMEPSLFSTFANDIKNLKKELDNNIKYKGDSISENNIKFFETLAENNNPIIVKCTLK